MLNNLKIGPRLILGFSIVLALLIGIAIFSINALIDMNAEVDNMVEDKYPKTVLATDLVRAMNQVAQINRNLLIITDPAELLKQEARQNEQRKTITETIDKLDEMIASPEGKKLMAKIQEARTGYVAVLDKYKGMIQRNERDAATKLLYGEFRPATDAYMGAIRGLIDFQDELMTQAGKDAEAAYVSTRNILLILTVIAILAAIGITLFIVRSITRPLAQTVDAANKMAAGDLNFSLQSTAKDEVGEVLRAVASVQASIKALVADANLLLKASCRPGPMPASIRATTRRSWPG